jgi:hypothetical protein
MLNFLFLSFTLMGLDAAVSMIPFIQSLLSSVVDNTELTFRSIIDIAETGNLKV